jgi:putative membrane protein
MMDGTWGTGWGPGFGFGFIFMILFWGLIIFAIVAIVKWLSGTSANAGTPPTKTVRQILDERYARGEIDKEEYEQKKRDIDV